MPPKPVSMSKATLVRGGFLLDGQQLVVADEELVTLKGKSFLKIESGHTASGQKKLMQRSPWRTLREVYW